MARITNRLLGPLLLFCLVTGIAHRGYADLLASIPALGSAVDTDEDVELNREADDRLMDGQVPVPVSLSELASSGPLVAAA